MPGVLRVLAICIEDPALIVGGMGRHVRELYRAMARRDDVEIDLLTIYPAEVDAGGRSVPFTEHDGYRRWTFSTICSQKPRFPSMRPILQVDVLWLARLVEMVRKGYEWDVIHAHEWSSWQVAQQASLALDLPIVATMHLCMTSLWDTDTALGPPDWLVESEEPKEPKAPKEPEAPPREVDSWMGNQEGKLVCEGHELILCSQAYCDLVEAYFYVESFWGKTPHLIPNGIDAADWYPGAGDRRRARRDHPAIGWRPIALFVGRIATMKGIEYLLQAVERSDTGYQVVIAGEVNADVGKEEWYVTRWIRALIERYPARLAWVGFQRDEALRDLYEAADVVVMPSTCEPSGIVGVEAMASGTPLIATAVEGLGELVREGDEPFAYVIPARDSAAISEALTTLRNDRTLHANLRQAGLARVRDLKFDWNSIARQTVEVYRQTVEAYHGC